MSKLSFSPINAADAREMFPSLVGSVDGALVCAHAQVAIVAQGRGAWSVMSNGQFKACCPSKAKARAFAEREAAVNLKHLSGSVRC